MNSPIHHRIDRRGFLQAAGLAALAGSGRAFGADAAWPTKPVRLVVPFPPGGPGDVLARALSQRLSAAWGQTIFVDNKAGGNTVIGAMDVVHSPGDGYTLFAPLDMTFTMNPALFTKLPYDPVKDFTPISIVARQPNVLIANNRTTAKTAAELIALAKASPGAINYAYSAVSTQIAGELFNKMAGIRLAGVPYKGSADVVKGMLAGDTEVSFDGIAANLPHIQSGRFRALATTGPTRAAALPDVPTMQELGLAGFDVQIWNAIAGPAKMPPAVVQKIHRDLVEVTRQPEVKAQMRVYGFEIAASSPAEMADAIQRDTVRFTPLLRELGIKLG